jgi:hypothetical protein
MEANKKAALAAFLFAVAVSIRQQLNFLNRASGQCCVPTTNAP